MSVLLDYKSPSCRLDRCGGSNFYGMRPKTGCFPHKQMDIGMVQEECCRLQSHILTRPGLSSLSQQPRKSHSFDQISTLGTLTRSLKSEQASTRMCLSKQSTWSAYAAVAYALSVAGLPALPALPGLPATPGLPTAGIPALPATPGLPTAGLPALPVTPGLPTAGIPALPATPGLPALPLPTLPIPTPSLPTLPISTPGLPTLPISTPALPALPISTPALPVLPGVGTVPSSLPSTGSLTKVPALPTSLPTDPSVVLKNNIVEAIQILQYIATELLSISLPGVGSVGIGSSLIPYLLSRVAGLLIVPGI